MNLLIDLGNTRIKWALDGGSGPETLAARSHGGTIDKRILDELWDEVPRPARIGCASVLGNDAEQALERWCRSRWGREVEFAASAARAFGIVNAYADPAQLGVDRWMALAGARSLAAGGFCVIDAGTAVTVDLVDPDGRHRGGWIVPGARLLCRSLTGGTARVRAAPGEAPPAWGTDTTECVQSGVEAMFGGLLRVLAERMGEHAAGAAEIFVTGGDAARFMRLLPAAREVPDLVLRGVAVMLAGSEAE